MIRTISEKTDKQYEWLDITDPEKQELHDVAARFQLHPKSVEDSLETDHLPKFEHLKSYLFVILRYCTPSESEDADSMKELTNRVAIFIADQLIITIHRHEWNEINRIDEELVNKGLLETPTDVLNELTKRALATFSDPAQQLITGIEHFEKLLFIRKNGKPLQKGLYYLKRKADVLRRVLLLSHDVIDHIDPAEQSNAITRDIRDLYIKQQSLLDSLSENCNHLITIYFNISSQRTNETIRVLTIFSVFFMPLTFIVGIYGMNFDFMPELRVKYGYPAVMILMLLVVLIIYFWFRRKNWL